MTEQSVLHNCGTCKFFLKANDKQGVCRRFPPDIIIVGQNPDGTLITQSKFPDMFLTGWCGEFTINLQVMQ